jgi:hypothetical protein
VALADGKLANSVDLLWMFHQKARQVFKGRDAETDALLKLRLPDPADFARADS